jgi:hypothetical protein
MADSPPPPLLSYRRPGKWQRRGWHRVFFALFVSLAVAGTIAVVRPLAARFAVRRTWQSAQANLLVPVPPGTVVAARNSARTGSAGNVYGMPAPWVDYDRLYVGKYSAMFRYAYIGFRTDSAGVSKVVIVPFIFSEGRPTGSRTSQWQITIAAQSFWPVTGWSEPAARASGPAWNQIVLPLFQTRFTVLAGQPDPRDLSRFSIECDGEGSKQTIDGQLQTDGTVTLKPRPKDPAVSRPTR